MIGRGLRSDWFGLILTLLLIVSVSLALHSDRPATPSEQVFAYGSLLLLAGWLLAVSWFHWRS
ncbi:hypothetical protein BH23PLA1_BH23PLA1_21900 [soil metagenome]